MQGTSKRAILSYSKVHTYCILTVYIKYRIYVYWMRNLMWKICKCKLEKFPRSLAHFKDDTSVAMSPGKTVTCGKGVRLYVSTSYSLSSSPSPSLPLSLSSLRQLSISMSAGEEEPKIIQSRGDVYVRVECACTCMHT